MNWLKIITDIKLPPLKVGEHSDPEDGLCAMEMVAYLERLPHSDHPACTCRILGAYVRSLNDRLGDKDRQKLLPLLPMLIGTVSPEHELARAEHFAWAAIKKFAPCGLRVIGLIREAGVLENFTGSLEEAAAAAYAAASAASAAAAAYAAASAASAAHGDYAYDAARSAAYAAASLAYGDYAYDAAHAAARSAAAAARSAAAAARSATSIEVLEEAIAIGPSSGFTKDVHKQAKELEMLYVSSS